MASPSTPRMRSLPIYTKSFTTIIVRTSRQSSPGFEALPADATSVFVATDARLVTLLPRADVQSQEDKTQSTTNLHLAGPPTDWRPDDPTVVTLTNVDATSIPLITATVDVVEAIPTGDAASQDTEEGSGPPTTGAATDSPNNGGSVEVADNGREDKEGMTTSIIALISVSAFAGVLIIVVAVYCVIRYKRKRSSKKERESMRPGEGLFGTMNGISHRSGGTHGTLGTIDPGNRNSNGYAMGVDGNVPTMQDGHHGNDNLNQTRDTHWDPNQADWRRSGGTHSATPGALAPWDPADGIDKNQSPHPGHGGHGLQGPEGYFPIVRPGTAPGLNSSHPEPANLFRGFTVSTAHNQQHHDHPLPAHYHSNGNGNYQLSQVGQHSQAAHHVQVRQQGKGGKHSQQGRTMIPVPVELADDNIPFPVGQQPLSVERKRQLESQRHELPAPMPKSYTANPLRPSAALATSSTVANMPHPATLSPGSGRGGNDSAQSNVATQNLAIIGANRVTDGPRMAATLNSPTAATHDGANVRTSTEVASAVRVVNGGAANIVTLTPGGRTSVALSERTAVGAGNSGVPARNASAGENGNENAAGRNGGATGGNVGNTTGSRPETVASSVGGTTLNASGTSEDGGWWGPDSVTVR